MLLKNIVILIFGIYLIGNAASVEVRITKVTGNVKVRYGVEEEWHPARTGMMLRDIDTILSGSDGSAQLLLMDGKVFQLGSNSYLDIVDLKSMDEKELFLFLMSKKVKDIKQQPDSNDRLKISSVSVVHGNSKIEIDSTGMEKNNSNWSEQETNGAVALYIQKFYPNTIVKIKKLMAKYSSLEDEGKFYFYLAKSFDALEMKGQAKENFQLTVDYYKNMDSLNSEETHRLEEAENSLRSSK